ASPSPRSGSRTALCLWLPTFELRLELVRSPGLDTTSVALLSPGEHTRRTIWQVSERAAASGVQPGQLVSQAVSLCPSLTLLEPDPAHYDAAAAAMLDALGDVSPVVEPAGRGRVFVGMDGLGRLHGRPQRSIQRCFQALFGVFPRPLVAATRAGWAPGRFAAWVAAVGARPGAPLIVEESALPAFLAEQPVAALPADEATLERLERLGIRTLGDLAALPTPALVAQFGAFGRTARAWATGSRIDPVRPFHRPRPVRVSLDLPAPVGNTEALRVALERLLDRALARPARQGRSVQGVRLIGHLEDGGSWSVDVVLRQPTASRDDIAFALRARMMLAPPQRAVERLTVEFFQFGPASRQTDVFDRREEAGRDTAARALDEGNVPGTLRRAVRELKLKLGYSPLYRVIEVDPWSRIPERRHALLTFDP
ncbi:MAG: DNA polymerase Y family protein, partial [Gemmatimonadetes bacterium]